MRNPDTLPDTLLVPPALARASVLDLKPTLARLRLAYDDAVADEQCARADFLQAVDLPAEVPGKRQLRQCAQQRIARAVERKMRLHRALMELLRATGRDADGPREGVAHWLDHAERTLEDEAVAAG